MSWWNPDVEDEFEYLERQREEQRQADEYWRGVEQEYYEQMYADWAAAWQKYTNEYGIYIEVEPPIVKSELTIEVKI